MKAVAETSMSLCRALVFVVAMPVLAQAQEDARIPVSQAPNAVEQLLSDGQYAAAREIAVAAVKTDPSNPLFLIALARADMLLGNFDEAIAAGQAAWRNAKSDNIRYFAAKTVAKAQFDAGNFTRSQIWLRRARQYAPNAELASQVAQDYRAVSAQNPWTTSLRFGVMPSSNINNGSASATSELFGLPFLFDLDAESRALSGFELSAGVSSRYRVLQTDRSVTYLTVSADIRDYALSQSSRDALQGDYDENVANCETRTPDTERDACLAALSPIKTGADYADATLSYGIHHKQILTEGAIPTDFIYRAGRTWYGGTLYARYDEAIVAHNWALGDNDFLQLSLSGNSKETLDATTPYLTQTAGIGGRWSHAKGNGDRYELSVDVRRSKSPSPDSDYLSVSYGANYDFSKPVNGMRFGFGITREARNYDASIYAPGPRDDTSLTFDMSINFTNIEYYGFQPVVNLSARRNDSSINLFDRDYTSVGFDLRSSF